MRSIACAAAAAASALTAASFGAVIVDYTVDVGGNNTNPVNGMAASATFDATGSTLTVLLQNTSTGVPVGAEVADSLLVSLAFNLPDDITIVSGDSAVIGAGSVGLGAWSGLTAGDSVSDQWLWTNGFGGDFLASYAQVISTSSGLSGTGTHFGSGSGSVGGPFGGIAASPALVPVPGAQPAVSDSIAFTLTLSEALSESQLQAVADASVVEFGSDFQYLAVPAPGAAALLLSAACTMTRRRRRC